MERKTKNQIVIFGGKSHPDLVRAICEELLISPGKIESFTFANHQRFVRLGENVRGKHVFLIQTATEKVDEEIIELFLMIDAAKRADASEISLVLPYFPYVRSEKKNQPRIAIAASMLAGIFEEYFQVQHILTLDLHAPAIQGFFRKIPCDELHGAPLFREALVADGVIGPKNNPPTILVASDAGAEKNLGGRYGKTFPSLPQATIQKRRVGNTDKIEIIGLAGKVENQRAILYDDEIATGGTLCGDAKYLVEKGAQDVIACCTHGILAGDAPEKIAASPISTLYVTDSLPISEEKIRRSANKIKVVSLGKLFAKAIAAIAFGGSIQNLLK